jgi:hypothetical protein
VRASNIAVFTKGDIVFGRPVEELSGVPYEMGTAPAEPAPE